MAKNTLKEQEALKQEMVVETVSKTDQFLKEHKNQIYGGVIAILLIALATICYHKFYLIPKKQEAMEQMYPAENKFRSQEFELALKGDGNILGFEQIIKEYGSKASTDVYFYAGICELQLGNYEGAIKYLKKYDGKEPILAARALGCIGDAYVGLENFNKALNFYDKAAKEADNMFAADYLLKAGIVCEELGNTAKALKYYEEIKDQYPNSMQGYDIDKYISRAQTEIAAE